MDTTGGYQSLLGLTSINSNSSTIDVLDVENININGVIDLSQAIVGGLTTSQVDEGLNLYYTDTRVNNNSNVSSNTTHRDRTDNPHGVTATQVGIDDTDDISEGVTNLYYTDIRFDNRLATKTTSSLTEGSNLYYTDARFDTRLATKTTTNLAEGSNLYYTDVRFDNRLLSKTTTDLAEGTNLYYTDARFDTRFAIKTTTDLTEGTNLYYTETRVSANTDVKANSDYRAVGHLPLSGGILSGDLSINGEVNVGGAKISRGATNGLQLYGTSGNISGPHIQAFVSSDTYPVYQQLNWSHNALWMCFDAYYESSLWRSSSSSSNLVFYKSTNTLYFQYDSGISAGSTITWNTGLAMSLTNGFITLGNGLYVTVDATINGELNVGGSKIARGATNGLQLRGTSGNLSGPHLQAFVSSDTYPVFQQLNWTHNNINLCFDSYYDGSWRSSSTSSNALINKGSTSLNFWYDSGISLGSVISWNTGLSMNTTNGLITCGNGLSVTGNITVSGTVDGVDVAALNTSANNHIANTNNPHGVLASQITDFDTEVSANTDVKANTAKVSADGSIDTHSDVSILEVQDQQFLKYSSFTQKWANVTATTAMIAEYDNLYYTDARFDTRFATKTTTNLTEGTNLYYTEARFDTSFGVKKTTDLTEGINLYYTDARFDTRFGIKTTTNLTEGSNLYYTEARVSANTDVKANSDYRGVGHLPLSGGIMTGDIIWDTDIEIPTWSSNTVYTPSDDPNWSISSSSFFSSSYQTFEAFNKTVDGNGTNCWISAAGRYNTNGTVNASTYTTTQVDGSNSYQGE